MIVDLDVPAIEIARPVLHVRFGGPLRPHLRRLAGTLAGDGPRRRVVVGILAASHQVVVDGAVVETVTCDDPTGTPVEPGTVVDLPHLRFHSSWQRVDAGGFGPAVDGLLAACAAAPQALAARFPNDPRAVTAVVLDARGWRTTHTYPHPGGGGVLVTTETELT